MTRYLLFLILALASVQASAQDFLAAPPLQGHTTPTTIRISLVFRKITRVTLQHETASGWSPETYLRFSHEQGWSGHYATVYVMDGLLPGKPHKLRIHTEEGDAEFLYTTPVANEVKDFTFLLGSCAFIGTGAEKLYEVNPPVEIFSSMRSTPHDFMLWTGDNVYYIWPEYLSAKGMVKKQTKIRMVPEMSAFIGQGIHIATWDDHDFGPNNSDRQFGLKDSALSIFRRFWATPTHNPGQYYKWAYADVEFFLLDDRTYRDNEGHTCILGKVQVDWLKQELKASKATFKFLVLGSQLLNPENPHETWSMYQEQREFFAWTAQEGIDGLVCLSGDRHFTELQRVERPGSYPVHDLTCSPLTSFLRKMDEKDPEWDNPTRVPGTLTLQHNYGALTVEGPAHDRRLVMRVMSVEGKELWRQVIAAKDLH